MKRILCTLCLFLILPFNILAYSNYIIPGGENIGITINAPGLVVVGFYKVDGAYIASKTLKVGDVITNIEGYDVSTSSEMAKIIDENIENNEVDITIKRNNKTIDTKLTLIKENDIYKTGLYVKEKINGIGTLTYIDPITKIYGALGHEIIMSEANYKVEVKNGSIFDSYVTGIDRSINGNVGSKNATILYNSEIGSVKKNTSNGLFGNYQMSLPEKGTMEIMDFDEIKLGKAEILTTLNEKELKSYEIKITDLNKKLIDTNKSISFIITDENLIDKTGGVVQGMSGSPIIQNDKIVGAVTHVVVEDVKKGYGIYIKTMLEEGEK